ncbi:(S)-2-haloacid dehalogenase IVA [Acrodontium crateriforme]|uniref:(S)-2-haloacid dehalogenase IVA n=1 Tax=Acrodontium crateriforme TaxID=150365 RepID=A0AAQ3RCS0_9PEZI|nr:(S)-2-haloacid dehalogenase IVA [Acrodontium crateriforme]
MSADDNQPKCKALLFDFMGTCLDWHSTILSQLPETIPQDERSALCIEWRHRYFDSNTARQARGEPPEDIDVTHRRVLAEVLAQPEKAHIKAFFTPEVVEELIGAWHRQKAWPDVRPALQSLREKGYEVFVHANGTTRLQLNNARSANLQFNMMFSSQLLGVYKPAPEAYLKTLDLIKRRPEECVMVAAHASDVRGAKAVGMKTVYIHRWTDDVNEDQEVVQKENDAYLEGMKHLVETIDKL